MAARSTGRRAGIRKRRAEQIDDFVLQIRRDKEHDRHRNDGRDAERRVRPVEPQQRA